MKKAPEDKLGRRSVMTGMGAAVAGMAAVAATSVAGQTQETTGFEPMRHDLDAWMEQLPGSHRTFLDTASPLGGGDALRYAFNILNAHGNAYGGEDSDYAMIVCYRHLSTPFGFNDAMWEKYGEIFKNIIDYADPATGEAATVNLLDAGNSPFTIAAIGNRGVKFAICSAATAFFAGIIAGQTGSDTDEVVTELMANAIPNSRFVPAGVMALTRAQEYGYSLLYAG